MASGVVAFHLLGPLRATLDGESVSLGGPRPRAVLAVLLLSANRLVPMDSLIDAVWGEHPPDTARRQVQNCVSALRGVLGDHDRPDPLIVAEEAGYRIRPPAGSLDAQIFADEVVAATREAAQGRHVEAAARLRSALDLWRGPALLGLPGRAIERGAASLEEQRLAALELRFEVELALGRHGEVVAELVDAVAEQPLRERLVGYLMQALHRVGRQAEAFHAYQRLRKDLEEELGIDPSPALQQLYAAMLTNDPDAASVQPAPGPQRAAVAAPLPVPAQLPVDVAAFVGRAEQLRALDELASTAAGVMIAAVAGTAGVGKTALAVHWAHRVRDRFPDGQLFVNLNGHSPDVPTHPGRVLAQLLSALGVAAERIPADVSAAAGLYRSVLDGQRVLIVLDNAANLEQVLPLLPGSAGVGVLVTSRDQLTGLAAAVGAPLLTLDVVTDAEAAELLAARIGGDRLAAEPEAVARIVTFAARLPLALAVVAARAAAHPGFPLAALADELRESRSRLNVFDGGAPTADVRAVLSWSYQRLDAPAARLFRLLGLHPGPDIEVRAAASLAGEPVAATGRAIADLARANLVAEHVPGRYGFHDLLRAYAAELAEALEPEPERRAAVARMHDYYLHSALVADRLTEPQREPLAAPAPARGVTVAEPGVAVAALAWFHAERQVLLAVADLAATDGHDGHAWRLVWALGPYLDRRRQWRDFIRIAQAGIEAARREQDGRATASMHRLLAMALTAVKELADAEHHYEQAAAEFARAGDRVGEAYALLNSAGVGEARGDYAVALQRVEAAAELFRAAGHAVGERIVLTPISYLSTQLGDHERTLSVCRSALADIPDLTEMEQASMWSSSGHAHRHLGDYRQAIDCFHHALDLLRRAGHARIEATILRRLGESHQALGELDAALDAWRRALAVLDELPADETGDDRAELRELLAGASPGTHP
jgi:DNA-binding SARP family transcriptional activator